MESIEQKGNAGVARLATHRSSDMRRTIKRIAFWLAIVLALLAGGGYLVVRASALPPSLNMGDMPGMNHDAMSVSIPVTELVAPASDAPIKAFTLTAQMTAIALGGGKMFDAWTYNGSAPGPELRVQQGDQVVVTLKNKDIAAGVTIHWHGVSVPNTMDGVAGITQDAVKPGESFTYRFIASEPGTYWYHSHQSSSEQVLRGLYGLLIIEPATTTTPIVRDYAIDLRDWADDPECFSNCNKVLTLNGQIGPLRLDAAPGELVRLRLLNSGQDMHYPVLLGAPATVAALDGHDLNAPTPLDVTRFPIASAQRYDLVFRMPAQGSVWLIDAEPQAQPADQHPIAQIGAAQPAATPEYRADAPLFDMARYGAPRADAWKLRDPVDATFPMLLGNRLGLLDGRVTMTFTINGAVNPYVPPIIVKRGQRVRLHIDNPTDTIHPMHLHGHSFAVLARNGQPLAGSPVVLDTVAVEPGESYDIDFLANNPGLWMDHCHVLRHAARGMSVMVVYENVTTPFNIGSVSGNHPE